ncbi:hypothetical protein B0H34DRAFT_373656 [Crassisporium funariophilum]|nr:hypothetical protein B0H34DRAFT_373656 [Crassisporium funariophilum]
MMVEVTDLYRSLHARHPPQLKFELRQLVPNHSNHPHPSIPVWFAKLSDNFPHNDAFDLTDLNSQPKRDVRMMTIDPSELSMVKLEVRSRYICRRCYRDWLEDGMCRQTAILVPGIMNLVDYHATQRTACTALERYWRFFLILLYILIQLGVRPISHLLSSGMYAYPSAPDLAPPSQAPESTRIVSGSHDKTIWVWDACIGNTVAGPFHTNMVTSVALSPGGTSMTPYASVLRQDHPIPPATLSHPLLCHASRRMKSRSYL